MKRLSILHVPKSTSALIGISLLVGTLFLPMTANAAVTQPTPSAHVSFTFDDGLASAYTTAAPTLAAYGLAGTGYITTDCIGMTTVPNACPADNDMPYMSWEQLTNLQNTYGWEIGGHTKSHPQLATDGLTDAELSQQIAGGKQALVDHGFNPVSFAAPYGDYDNRVLAEVAKHYSSFRGFWDVDNNVWPFNDYLINNMQVQTGVSVNQVKAKIDEAIANNQWLVLTFHEIRANASTDPQDYQYKTADLDAIAAYVKTKQDAGLIKATNVKDGLPTSTNNLLAGGGFDSGIADGWSTDKPADVALDTTGRGSFAGGSATGHINSVKFVAGSGNSHLFSPLATVASDKTYMIKSYLNMTARTSGELGYYIDEYDANGNWISGQWIKSETTPSVKRQNLSYTPGSANVKKASLQIYVTGNSGITAYIDNVQWYPVVEDTTTPPPSNTGTNVMPNSAFDAGIGTGWTTNNSAAFTPDATSNGSPENPVNSVKLTAPATNASLFAPKVDVDSTVTYTIKAFLRILTLTSGELGFYVDEYDANGNWISGQYITGQRSTFTGDITFSYTPSSSNVKKAGLQIILVGNSGITGYVDNVQWIVPTGGGDTPPPDPTPTTITVMDEGFNSGLPAGWAGDSANITVETGAVKMTAETSKNIHLFAPKVDVSSTKIYNVSADVNVTAFTSGEVAFYIDEYDAAGNWVSGKYVTGIHAAGSQTLTFDYVPTSASVAKASLQVIVTSNSGITAYVDNIKITTTA
jgi:peptidoglycan/xylan/chitin deacetylase (PgdA/CDA1 family)